MYLCEVVTPKATNYGTKFRNVYNTCRYLQVVSIGKKPNSFLKCFKVVRTKNEM